MNPIISLLLRKALLVVSAYLVSKGLLEPGSANAWVSANLEILIGLSGGGLSVALSILDKLKNSIFQLNGKPKPFEKIDAAIKSKKKVYVFAVYRDPVESLIKGAIPRAKRMGRSVPIDEHANTHVGIAKTIFDLESHYRGNPNVEIKVIDNSKGKGKAVHADSGVFKKNVNKDKLLEKLKNEIIKLKDSGEISPTLYKGFMGKNE